jgi:serine/threonine protein kinase
MAVAHAPARSPPDAGVENRERLGTVLLGKYRLESILGVGGMAVVYKATHRNGAERAIKMLLPEHASNEDIRRRFRREGRLANAVQHPGAVSVIDDDVSDDGVAFLVLELLRGLACNDLFEASFASAMPLSCEAACCVALQTLDVLQAAHDHGIVHRDIKPANLFVLHDGTVKVLDFGIARLRQRVRETASAAQRTTTGVLLGTPAFMAPEQALPRGADVDERADIWAVGATLFTLLSGRAARPTCSLAAIAPHVPLPLVDAVDRALQLDRALRWESAHAMRTALDRAWRASFGHSPNAQTLARAVEAANARRQRADHFGHQAARDEVPPSSIRASVSDAAPLAPPWSPPEPRGSRGPHPRAVRHWRARTPLWCLAGACVAAGAWHAASSVVPGAPSRTPQSATVSSSSANSDDAPVLPPASRAPATAAPPARNVVARSCADARDAGVHDDGPVRIDPDGAGPLRAFEVYCTHMADAAGLPPREYITLAHGDAAGEPEANATRYVWGGGECDCPDLVRRFSRVRLDLATMAIDPTDGTFARYDRARSCEGRQRNHCGEDRDLAWGAPGSCRAAEDASGTASIDLRGTPFALAPSARFVPTGFRPNGRATVSGDRKTASIAGGGSCGFMVSREPEIAVVQDR